MVEWCYNTTCHTSIGISSFKALYGYPLAKLMTYILGTTANVAVDLQLRSREQPLSLLRENLHKAQQRIKMFADRKRIERSFEVGE